MRKLSRFLPIVQQFLHLFEGKHRRKNLHNPNHAGRSTATYGGPKRRSGWFRRFF